MRYYRRVGRRSGVSMGLGTYLVALALAMMALAVVVAAYWMYIVGAVLAVIVLRLVVSGVSARRGAEAAVAKAAADKARLEQIKRDLDARRAADLEQAKALVDEAMEGGAEQRRVLLAQARGLVTDRGLNTLWEFHPEGKLELARYIDEKRALAKPRR